MILPLAVQFSIYNSIAMLNWLIMFVAPKAKPTVWLRQTKAIPIFFSVVYLLLFVVPFFMLEEGGFRSLEAVDQLFQHKQLLLAGWVHYLAFDLLVGYTIQEYAIKANWKFWIYIPLLLLTFMFGPVGYLVFRITKTITNERHT